LLSGFLKRGLRGLKESGELSFLILDLKDSQVNRLQVNQYRKLGMQRGLFEYA
jgi:hypothetical protein